ncbi:hypothetical protein F2Q70_00007127 [Brassica cretica]|uniref:Anaphase-promoting complex subunit 1 C-terminal domain-containing protein n=1 Tax=Brassica cretica TaxID=69181 RepID=A0A8S9LXI1_BRACR|nr:hypothetical protein F2Q70_00007127 [Brassica cretica]
MSPGVRRLTVLGKFKPFGLIAEATDDGKPPDLDVADSYEYFLFDPHLTGQREDGDGNEANFSRQREHELFSLLSRAMHKVVTPVIYSLAQVFGLRTLDESNTLASSHRELDSDSVDHLVSTFSSDPSLIAFAQLCCDKSWNDRSDSDFKEFCLQVLFDCISKDRPALLQVYLSLYTTIASMADLLVKTDSNVCDSLSISSLKVALAYNEAVTSGRLASSGGFVQSIFLASLGKRCEEILNCSTELKINLRNYLTSEAWSDDSNSKLQKDTMLLSWYLKWFSVPSPSIIRAAVEKIKSKFKISTSAVPLLRLLLPSTHISAISEIDRVFFPSNVTIAL